MTQLSPSAREAAEKAFIAKYGSLANHGYHDKKEGFIAGYQARDSEGKGEAGEVEEQAWLYREKKTGKLIASKTNTGMCSLGYEFRGEVTMPAPPAPKDERVEKLRRSASDVIGMHRKIFGEDPKPEGGGVGYNGALWNLMEALRAYEGGGHG